MRRLGGLFVARSALNGLKSVATILAIPTGFHRAETPHVMPSFPTSTSVPPRTRAVGSIKSCRAGF